MATKKVKKVAKNAVKSCAKKKVCAKKKETVEKIIKVEPIKVEKKIEKKVECCAKKQEEAINNNSYVLVDYPVENDVIKGNAYVLRIASSNDFNAYVEVSFNNGEWNLCRYASGYWWYDWAFFKPGQFTLRARIVSASDGKVIKMSDIRKFKVD